VLTSYEHVCALVGMHMYGMHVTFSCIPYICRESFITGQTKANRNHSVIRYIRASRKTYTQEFILGALQALGAVGWGQRCLLWTTYSASIANRG
jgi:hypothetical protein